MCLAFILLNLASDAAIMRLCGSPDEMRRPVVNNRVPVQDETAYRVGPAPRTPAPRQQSALPLWVILGKVLGERCPDIPP